MARFLHLSNASMRFSIGSGRHSSKAQFICSHARSSVEVVCTFYACSNMASLVSASTRSFSDVYNQLLSLPPPLLPPGKATDPDLADTIASLYLHPSIEAGLHILNADLPSAHFLCRHMQAAPQFEGMFLHGILHRIEGDYDNARAWYGDVADSDVFRATWDERGKAFELIDAVQAVKERRSGVEDADAKAKLGRESGREIRSVIDFCVVKFGSGKMQDASQNWKQPGGEHQKLGQDMVSGDKGFRRF